MPEQLQQALRRASMNAKELFGHWAEVREGLLQALDKLTDAQLDFVPREGLWSLGTVARHIANAEGGWFRYAVARELAEWPVEYTAEEYPTIESIKALLTEVHARTEAYLVTVNAAYLDQAIEVPWGAEISLRWIIWHVLEHEIHHRGEIFLMLGMLGLEGPDI
jgi:uncharacterized damage-inducible protein DinB